MKVITKFDRVVHDKPVKIIISPLSKIEMKAIKVADCKQDVITVCDRGIMYHNGAWYKIKTEEI